MASETQEEATDSQAASAPALCHTSRLLEDRNTSRILPPWSDDVVMSGVWNGEPRQSTEVHRLGTVGIHGGPPSAWDNRRGTRNGSRTRTSASSASRRWTCPECSYQNYAWRGYCHSCTRAVSFGRTWHQWRWQSCKEAGSASDFRGLPLGGVRKVAWRRLSDSLSSEAMAVEDADPVKGRRSKMA